MSVFVNLSICLFVFFNLSVTDKGAASTGRLAGTEVLFIQLAGWFEILTLLIAFECVAVLPPYVIVFLSLYIFVDNTHITNYHKKTNRKSENEHLSSISWNHNGQCE